MTNPEIKLERIADTSSPIFGDVWAIYEEAFPPDERRKLEQQRALFANTLYDFFAAQEGEEVVGLLAAWRFDGFTFIEHYAIRRDLRNKGRGTRLMKGFLAGNPRIVLETEHPGTEPADRRIKFYKERVGFTINDNHDYIQPAYSADKNPVPLFLVTHPGAIDQKEFLKVRETLHTRVYGLAQPLVKLD